MPFLRHVRVHPLAALWYPPWYDRGTVCSFSLLRNGDDGIAARAHRASPALVRRHCARRLRARGRADARRRLEQVRASCRLTCFISSLQQVSQWPSRRIKVRADEASALAAGRARTTHRQPRWQHILLHMSTFCCSACAAASEAATEAATTTSNRVACGATTLF